MTMTMDEATFAQFVVNRPFAFTEFVLMPLIKNDSLTYHREQCERIKLGRFGVVIVDHEDGESDYHVVSRAQTGELLAVGYHSLAGYVSVNFPELPEARKFLTHLRTCPLPERAPKHVFEQARAHQETLEKENILDEAYE